jgi:hypothetical protein
MPPSQPAGVPVAPPIASIPLQYVVGDYFSMEGRNFLVLGDRFTGWLSIYEAGAGLFENQDFAQEPERVAYDFQYSRRNCHIRRTSNDLRNVLGQAKGLGHLPQIEQCLLPSLQMPCIVGGQDWQELAQGQHGAWRKSGQQSLYAYLHAVQKHSNAGLQKVPSLDGVWQTTDSFSPGPAP